MKIFSILMMCVLTAMAFVARAQEAKKMLVPYHKGLVWGYADTTGQIVIEPKFDEAGFFREEENLYYATGKLKDKSIIIMEDGTYMDDEFSSGITSMWGELEQMFFDGIQEDASLSKKGKHGFRLDNAVLRKAPVYDNVYDFLHDGQLAVFSLKATKQLGVVDQKGNVLLPFMYDGVITINYKDLYFGVQKAGMWYLVDKDNKRISDAEYQELYRAHGGLARAKRNNKYGFLNLQGMEVIPFRYDRANDFGDDPAVWGFAWVGYWGFDLFINEKGKEFGER